MTDEGHALLKALKAACDKFCLNLAASRLSQEDHVEMALTFIDMADRLLKRMIDTVKIISLVGGSIEDVANLRNQVGGGHGVVTLPDGLNPRHGRLAVRVAITWCTFMLDTLADRRN